MCRLSDLLDQNWMPSLMLLKADSVSLSPFLKTSVQVTFNECSKKYHIKPSLISVNEKVNTLTFDFSFLSLYWGMQLWRWDRYGSGLDTEWTYSGQGFAQNSGQHRKEEGQCSKSLTKKRSQRPMNRFSRSEPAIGLHANSGVGEAVSGTASLKLEGIIQHSGKYTWLF